MDSPEKVTAQGVRDLNDRGPKRKPAPAVDAAATGAAPATEDQTTTPVVPTEDAAPAAKIDNG